MTVEDINHSIKIREDRQSFINRISDLPPGAIKDIMYAYRITKAGHKSKGQMRESGGRYFEHPRFVALILIDELKNKDPELIQAALMHDLLEDTDIFGNAAFNTYEQNKEEAYHNISKSFSHRVAEIVVSVSKPKGTDAKELDTDRIYHDLLVNAPVDAILVKACDRLHNLRTLGGTPHDKQVRKVNETKEEYFPLFKKLEKKYPNEYQYLMTEMNKAIGALGLE